MYVLGQPVAGETRASDEDDDGQRRSVRAVLRHLLETGKQRHHHHAAPHPCEAAEEASRYAGDDRAGSLRPQMPTFLCLFSDDNIGTEERSNGSGY